MQSIEKGGAVQNIIKLNDFQKELKNISDKNYYFFLIGFTLGLTFKETMQLNKKETQNIIKKRKEEIIKKDNLEKINEFLTDYNENEYLFSDFEKKYLTFKKTAEEVDINNFGNETMQRSFAFFHYQYYQDVDRTKNLLNLVSPTATLHYMGYDEDRYICFYCNRGCIYRKKYK